jgi:hypothetical protein
VFRLLLSFSLLLSLAGCASAPKELALPEAVAGGWKRTSVSEIAKSELPNRIASLKLTRALRGNYDGPTTVEVDVYQFASSAAAFEARQSWLSDGKRMVHQRNDLFLTAHSPQPDRSALESFLTALEKSL